MRPEITMEVWKHGNLGAVSVVDESPEERAVEIELFTGTWAEAAEFSKRVAVAMGIKNAQINVWDSETKKFIYQGWCAEESWI